MTVREVFISGKSCKMYKNIPKNYFPKPLSGPDWSLCWDNLFWHPWSWPFISKTKKISTAVHLTLYCSRLLQTPAPDSPLSSSFACVSQPRPRNHLEEGQRRSLPQQSQNEVLERRAGDSQLSAGRHGRLRVRGREQDGEEHSHRSAGFLWYCDFCLSFETTPQTIELDKMGKHSISLLLSATSTIVTSLDFVNGNNCNVIV